MTHRAGRPMIQLDTKKIVDLYDKGDSLRTLAKKFNVSYVTISKRVHKEHELKAQRKREISLN